MCLSCGCNKAHDDHGDDDYITFETLQKAAKLDGISVNDVIKNINDGAIKDRVNHEDEYTDKQ